MGQWFNKLEHISNTKSTDYQILFNTELNT